MSIMSSKLIRHEICKDDLKHLGAKFIDIEGDIYRVSFKLETIQITYVYGIDETQNFYLERIQPYILFLGNYASEEEIVKSISNDVDHFKKVMRYADFQEFIDVNNRFSHLIRSIEILYLSDNLTHMDMSLITEKVEALSDKIQGLTNQSTISDNKERL